MLNRSGDIARTIGKCFAKTVWITFTYSYSLRRARNRSRRGTSSARIVRDSLSAVGFTLWRTDVYRISTRHNCAYTVADLKIVRNVEFHAKTIRFTVTSGKQKHTPRRRSLLVESADGTRSSSATNSSRHVSEETTWTIIIYLMKTVIFVVSETSHGQIFPVGRRRRRIAIYTSLKNCRLHNEYRVFTVNPSGKAHYSGSYSEQWECISLSNYVRDNRCRLYATCDIIKPRFV